MTDPVEGSANSTEAAEPPVVIARWVGFLLRAYIPLLLLAALISWFSFDLAKGLKLNADITSLMPDGVPSVTNLRQVIKKTGGYSSVMVMVVSPDADAALRYLEDLRTEVLKFDWAASAEYAEDTAVFEHNRLIYVDQEDLREIDRRLAERIDYEKKNLKFSVDNTPVEINIRGSGGDVPPLHFDDIEEKYTGKKAGSKKTNLFRNDKGDLTIMVVFPEGSVTDVNFSMNIMNDLEDAVVRVDPKKYNADMTVVLGGRINNRVASFQSIMADVKGSGLWSISLIFLVIAAFYRRLMSIFYIGLPLVVGFLMTFALTQVTLGGLNLITVFLVLILFGLGIDFGIHNLARYDEVRKGGGDMVRALTTIYSKTGYAALLAGVTTVVGFYSLMTTNFKAFYEFGFIAGSGVALTLFSMYLFFPALMVFSEKIRLYRVPKRVRTHGEASKRPFPAPGLFLLVGGALVAVGLMMAPHIQFENDFDKLTTRPPGITEKNAMIREVFPLGTDQAVIFVDELEDVGPLVDELERIRQSKTGDDATISKIRSIYSVVPRSEDQKERMVAIDDIEQRLLDAMRLLEDFGDPDDPRKQEIREALKNFGVSTLTPEDLPTPVQRLFTGVPGSGGYLVYVYNKKGTSKYDEAKAFVDDIRTVRANGKTFYPATEAMIFVDMLNLMKKDATRAVVVVLISVTIVLILAFRSLKHVLLVLVPVVVGMIWMLGLMAALDIKLNIFNMVVLPTVLGIGIDNGIHIFHRYREEEGKLYHVVKTTGAAAFLTTLTTMLGFVGTLTASNQGLESLGVVACLGLGCCMVSSLTVFPALLQVVDNRRTGPRYEAAMATK